MVTNNKLQMQKSSTSIGAKIFSEMKTGIVEEKPTKPTGVQKFQRRTVPTQPGHPTAVVTLDATAGAATDKTNSASAICQQMLVQGFVQSYVDFYHLTHRLESSNTDEQQQQQQQSSSSTATTSTALAQPTTTPITIAIPMSSEDLFFIRDNLLQAEVARRQGNTSNVYTAYTKLADYYVQRKDWKTSFFFHEKCLEVAQLTNDLRAEMSANHSLGSINQMMLSFDRARMHHERHEQLAESVEVFDEIAKANAELYKVYLILAEQKDALSLSEEALELYQLALQAAKKSWDKNAEAEANGRIGSLLLHRGETQASVPFLKQQSQLAADLGNAESRCHACTSLALAWDLLQQPDKALEELTLVNSISEQSGDVFLQAQACRALGTMYSKIGKLDQAVEVLQRHFTLLKSILSKRAKSSTAMESATKKVTETDLDLARAYIGVSRGNQLMGSYVLALQFDFVSLLDWKLNRSELKSSAQTAETETEATSTATVPKTDTTPSDDHEEEQT
jgi:tetratricopeptide (TPR) repeat protein